MREGYFSTGILCERFFSLLLVAIFDLSPLQKVACERRKIETERERDMQRQAETGRQGDRQTGRQTDKGGGAGEVVCRKCLVCPLCHCVFTTSNI